MTDEASIVTEAYSFPDVLVQQFGYIQQHLISVEDEVYELSRKLERLKDTVEKVRSMLTEKRQNSAVTQLPEEAQTGGRHAPEHGNNIAVSSEGKRS